MTYFYFQDKRSSLLQFVVTQYIKKFEKDTAGTDKVAVPVPDTYDISQSSLVNFDEIEKELHRIKKDFEGKLLPVLYD